MPSFGWYRPTVQFTQYEDVAVSTCIFPELHARHSEAPVSLNLPTEQFEHSTVAVPEANLFLAHFVQDVV